MKNYVRTLHFARKKLYVTHLNSYGVAKIAISISVADYTAKGFFFFSREREIYVRWRSRFKDWIYTSGRLLFFFNVARTRTRPLKSLRCKSPKSTFISAFVKLRELGFMAWTQSAGESASPGVIALMNWYRLLIAYQKPRCAARSFDIRQLKGSQKATTRRILRFSAILRTITRVVTVRDVSIIDTSLLARFIFDAYNKQIYMFLFPCAYAIFYASV